MVKNCDNCGHYDDFTGGCAYEEVYHYTCKSGYTGWVERKPQDWVEPDIVERPRHYTEYPKEVVDIIKFILDGSDLSPFEAWCVGNEIKYRLHAGLKNYDKRYEDIDKAMKVRTWRNE